MPERVADEHPRLARKASLTEEEATWKVVGFAARRRTVLDGWGGGDKALRHASVGSHCSTGSSSGCGRRSMPSCSMPMAIPPALLAMALPIVAEQRIRLRRPAGRRAWPGLDWAASQATRLPLQIASVATDAPIPAHRSSSPGLPMDGIAADADLACAASGGRAHPVFGLWPVRLARRPPPRDGRGGAFAKVDLWTRAP